MNPLVSIIIPTFNRVHLIGETLDCVLAQTYANWECIVVDDFSTDNTKNIVERYLKKDDRFIFLSKPIGVKKGASISRNLGLKKAKGVYIQFLDSDDILAENKIEEQLKVLLKEGIYTLTTCKWEKFDNLKEDIYINKNKLEYVNFNYVKDYFDFVGLHGGFFPSHSFLMSKELINISGYWNQDITVNDDGEFFFRIILNSDKIIFTDTTYVLYRNTTINNLSKLDTEIKAISLVNSWKVIEVLYHTKFNDENSHYLNNKKRSIYFELRRLFPKVVSQNKAFFKKQIQGYTIALKFKKLKKRIINRLRIIFK